MNLNSTEPFLTYYFNYKGNGSSTFILYNFEVNLSLNQGKF